MCNIYNSLRNSLARYALYMVYTHRHTYIHTYTHTHTHTHVHTHTLTFNKVSDVGLRVVSLVRHWSINVMKRCVHLRGFFSLGGGFRGIKNNALIGCILHRAVAKIYIRVNTQGTSSCRREFKICDACIKAQRPNLCLGTSQRPYKACGLSIHEFHEFY